MFCVSHQWPTRSEVADLIWTKNSLSVTNDRHSLNGLLCVNHQYKLGLNRMFCVSHQWLTLSEHKEFYVSVTCANSVWTEYAVSVTGGRRGLNEKINVGHRWLMWHFLRNFPLYFLSMHLLFPMFLISVVFSWYAYLL